MNTQASDPVPPELEALINLATRALVLTRLQEVPRSILQPVQASLPVRLPGQHLHPQLRRPPLADPAGRAGSSEPLDGESATSSGDPGLTADFVGGSPERIIARLRELLAAPAGDGHG